MAYTAAQIIEWAKMCSPLARFGEAKKQSNGDTSADVNFDMKLYNTRKDVEYELAQDPTSDILFTIANYLYALCFPYILTAQEQTGGGGGSGGFTPSNPSTFPATLDWIVSATASSTEPLATGESTVIFNGTLGFPDLRGYNMDYFRGGQPQYTTDRGDGSTFYYWNKVSGLFIIYGSAQLDEPMRISPI